MHAARKVVGVGSVGTAAGSLLLVGRDDGDPLFLQAKEAQASVLERFVGASELRQPRRAGGGRPAADAGGERHLPRLDAHRASRRTGRATTTSASSTTGRAAPRSRRLRPPGAALYAPHLRRDARPRPRALGRPDRDRVLPGQGRRVRPGDRRLRRGYADQNERDYEAFAEAVRAGGSTRRPACDAAPPRVEGARAPSAGSGIDFGADAHSSPRAEPRSRRNIPAPSRSTSVRRYPCRIARATPPIAQEQKNRRRACGASPTAHPTRHQWFFLFQGCGSEAQIKERILLVSVKLLANPLPDEWVVKVGDFGAGQRECGQGNLREALSGRPAVRNARPAGRGGRRHVAEQSLRSPTISGAMADETQISLSEQLEEIGAQLDWVRGYL